MKININIKLINIFCLFAIVVLTTYTYWATLQWMYDRYTSVDSYYSHGFLIPFVSLFMIWQQRKVLHDMPQEFSISGFFLIIFSLLLHILGTILYIFSVSGLSLYILILSLTLFIFGWKNTKIILYPLLLLVFMFPLPMAVISLISFPLKMFVAKAGTWLVSILGIPTHREGFNIYIPAGHLLVGNPCSGLRSLIAFMALGAIFAYFLNTTLLKKFIFFMLAIPIALLSNIIRVPILILVSHFFGLEAAAPETLVHTASGLLVFFLGFILLFLSSKALK